MQFVLIEGQPARRVGLSQRYQFARLEGAFKKSITSGAKSLRNRRAVGDASKKARKLSRRIELRNWLSCIKAANPKPLW